MGVRTVETRDHVQGVNQGKVPLPPVLRRLPRHVMSLTPSGSLRSERGQARGGRGGSSVNGKTRSRVFDATSTRIRHPPSGAHGLLRALRSIALSNPCLGTSAGWTSTSPSRLPRPEESRRTGSMHSTYGLEWAGYHSRNRFETHVVYAEQAKGKNPESQQ